MSPRTKDQFKKMRSESKIKIVNAALFLFANKGYNATTISEVAKKAGVSKGLMYNYYNSKEDLLEEVVKMNIEEGVQIGENWITSFKDSPKEEVIDQIFDLFFDLMEEKKDLMKLSFALAFQVTEMPKIQNIIYNSFSRALEMMGQLLVVIGINENEVSKKLLAAQMDGIVLHRFVLGEEYDLESVKQGLKEKYKELVRIKGIK